MLEQPPTFEALLRGVRFRPIEAKAIVKDLEEGTPLSLEREPTNEHDANAIKVLTEDESEFLGYVAKEVAIELAPWMDQGWRFTCIMTSRMSTDSIIMEIIPVLSEEDDETSVAD